MAQLNKQTVHMRELVDGITLNVKLIGVRRFRIRIAIAMLLIRVAVHIAGFGLRMQVQKETE